MPERGNGPIRGLKVKLVLFAALCALPVGGAATLFVTGVSRVPLLIYLVMSMLAFGLYWYDKQQAKAGKQKTQRCRRRHSPRKKNRLSALKLERKEQINSEINRHDIFNEGQSSNQYRQDSAKPSDPVSGQGHSKRSAPQSQTEDSEGAGGIDYHCSPARKHGL